MEFLNYMPPFALAIIIFFMRIGDVSLGTIRTIAVIQGKPVRSLVLGFFEVLIWIFAVSQVISNIKSNLFLSIAYAGGFAAGNAVGIYIEKMFSKGMQVARIISRRHGQKIAATLRDIGYRITLFRGEGKDGPVDLLYVISPTRSIQRCISIAQKIDPEIFFITERVLEHNRPSDLYPSESIWRSVLKMK